ncbi:putative membrane protein [Leptospira weilii serovar Ranarum str. ICFT]|uniref:Membrane protein n=1 Tax=Leptospira weilii serovar Ranarum str. ICFT TaxID=1218598 RepID=N1WMD4_9LEPT|nr:histidine kinase N-terminal 7TM domain-containing protein [Leptospira weilii]EMY76943.1 putative membrane protein [Leptospira weilii serovar Ranarum str. ICFT]
MSFVTSCFQGIYTLETISALLLASACNLCLGFYVLFVTRQRKRFLDFGTLCILFGIWSALFAVPFFEGTKTTFWTRTLTLPMIAAPLLLIRFIHSYVFDKEFPVVGSLSILVVYVIPIYVFSYSDLYIMSAWIQDAKLHFTAGILYDYFVIGGILSIISSIIVLALGFKKRRGLNRVRCVYIATGILLWLVSIGTFTLLLRFLGLPEYNFVAPISCTLATAIWSIGIIKINLFELSESAILEEENSIVANANILILRKVDSESYKKALIRCRKNTIERIIQNFTDLQINSELSVEEIYFYMAKNERAIIPLKSYPPERS